MKKSIFFPILLPGLLMMLSCGKPDEEGGQTAARTVRVELSSNISATNGAGDVAYNFLDTPSVAYITDAGDSGTAAMAEEGRNSISGSFKVSGKAGKLWCYTPDIDVPAQVVKTGAGSPASFDGMGFCTPAITLSKADAVTGSIKPVTAAVVLDIVDSKGTVSGKDITSVTLSADNISLAGKVRLKPEESRIDEVQDASTSITISCSDIRVGTSAAPASLGVVVLPCNFTGSVSVKGDGFEGSIAIVNSLVFQAGYVKHITVDVARMRDGGGFPKRLGIIGDSISTFQGIIPSNHRAYYTNPPASGCDVDSWQKTYWGLLITEYWNCELDVNTSWSGSCVADGKDGSARTPFVDHSRLDLFKDPDTIILFGGTNDATSSNGIGLGSFDYDTPLAQMNTTKRFRDAYIYVIRYLQEKHPGVQIICIIGTNITGDYGTSVETIAKHFNLPYVDFRGERNVSGKVTMFSGSHPDAAGHAYKAKKIYEETLSLFQ